MIVTRTPLRISLAGGGTDIPAACTAIGGGAVVSFAIDRYVYIAVSRKFDGQVRVSHYDRNEVCLSADDVQHDLARECLRLVGIKRGVEIVSIADVPAGTGLGSSSSYTVGCLNALHALNGDVVPADWLAEEACRVEIDILGKPIGRQDQWIAALGGVRYLTFTPDGIVRETRLDVAGQRWALREALEGWLMVFYVGGTRNADAILAEQNGYCRTNVKALARLRSLACSTCQQLSYRPDVPAVNIPAMGPILAEGWQIKRSLAEGISNDWIDDCLQRAREAGATGGKLLGAGGAGFLLLCVPPERRQNVEAALVGLRRIDWHVEREGSRIVYRD